MTKLRIKMSPFGESFHVNEDHHIEAQHDWAEGTFLQGGDKGVVISRNPGVPNYTTAFVEAFPPESIGGGFFRGEGATTAEAETDAWEKWQVSQQCPGHEWETRGYRNGGGFCKHCKRFGTKVFTPEQLGQFCVECGVGAYWGQVRDEAEVEQWYCENHTIEAQTSRYRYLLPLEESGLLTKQQETDLWMIRSMYKVDEDGKVSVRTYE